MGDSQEAARQQEVAQDVDDPQCLRRTPIRRMVVDESGFHCILLAKSWTSKSSSLEDEEDYTVAEAINELFYNHWSSNAVVRISLSDEQFYDKAGA